MDGPLARRTVLVASIALGLFALLFVIWNGASALFTILAGIVLAALLDAIAFGLGKIVPLARKWRLLMAIALLLVLIVAFGYFAGVTVLSQIEALTEGSRGVFATLKAWLDNSPIGGVLPDQYSIRELVGSGFGSGGDAGVAGGLMSGATAFFTALSTGALILFLGCFFAWDPAVYRAGILSILPHDKRERVGEVLGSMGETLRLWLFGQMISMVVIGVLTTALLLIAGMPFALLLGLQAGLLAFIPTLGPLIAAVPILIAGATEGFTMVLWGLGIYVLVQGVESNLIMPLVQKRMISLPPAFTLGSQLLLGALFGFAGLALAVPLVAMLRVAVEALYVEDEMGGTATGHEGAEGGEDAEPSGRTASARPA